MHYPHPRTPSDVFIILHVLVYSMNISALSSPFVSPCLTFSSCERIAKGEACTICAAPVDEIDKAVLRAGDLDAEWGDASLCDVFKRLKWPYQEINTTAKTPTTNLKRISIVTDLLQREKIWRSTKKGGAPTKESATKESSVDTVVF